MAQVEGCPGGAPLSEEETRNLCGAFAARISDLARRGELASKPLIRTLLMLWEAMSGPDEPRRFVAERLADAAALRDIAFDLMSEITSTAEPYRYRKLGRLPRETIYDVGAMADALEGHLAAGALAEADLADAARFVRDVRRLLDQLAHGTRPQLPDDDD